MAQVTMQLVKELRDRTQAGLADCKSALGEAEGDIEKAIEIILKKGLAKSAKRAGAAAAEGEVVAKVAADGKSAVLVEVNIQTDFAARNDDFKAFVAKVVEVAEGADDGADIGTLPYPGGGGSVEEVRKALVGKLGENVVVRRWARLRVDGAGKVHSYVHMGGKVGVLLAAKLGDAAAESKPELEKFLDDTAMQAAAMAPMFLNKDKVDQNVVAKQKEIYDAQLVEEGKPEAARPKIIEGKVAKWLREVCLVEQASVIESDKTVDQLREDTAKALGTSLELVGFARFERGEGVEKKEDDFGAEVAAMAGGKN
ncbi:MAG: translation elongation factor Ts [Polyangiaceae bacterium]|nr:translation elongation factor Ts [Polyangiaceae bacterium]